MILGGPYPICSSRLESPGLLYRLSHCGQVTHVCVVLSPRALYRGARTLNPNRGWQEGTIPGEEWGKTGDTQAVAGSSLAVQYTCWRPAHNVKLILLCQTGIWPSLGPKQEP
jgi:hypothetical protein